MPTVNLNDVCVSDKPTHIVIYKEDGEYTLVPKSLLKELEELRERVKQLETKKARPSPFFSSEVAPEPEGLDVQRTFTDAKDTFHTIITKLEALKVEVPEAEAEEVEAEDVEAEEEVEEAEAEGEALELEEFEYKGTTYYRDSENQVYQQDADGDLDDTPIGVWNEAKQKLLKYKA